MDPRFVAMVPEPFLLAKQLLRSSSFFFFIPIVLVLDFIFSE
jgi:hypothetical protein